MERIANFFPLWYIQYPRTFILKLLTVSVGILEHLGSRYSLFGKLYNILLYRSMVTAETRAAGLKPGMKVLHIGSGPLPMTAISLGRAGCKVDAVDSDTKAVKAAARLVKDAGMENLVSVKKARGQDINCSSYDAVWISLHVFPKKKVLLQSFQSLKDGGAMIYRNPGSLLKYLYPQLEPEELDSSHHYPYQKIEQSLGKTVIIKKTKNAQEKNRKGDLHYEKPSE